MSENPLRESAERVLRRLRNETYNGDDLALAEQFAAWHREFARPDVFEWTTRFRAAADVADSRGCAPGEALRYVADWLASTPADNAEAIGRALLGEEP